MLIWLNGTFGVGKSATAGHLERLLNNARSFDPELVGYMLRECLGDHPVEDFQDWPAWRRLVATTAATIAAMTKQDIVAVQTVLREDYWKELRDGLADEGLEVFHVLLTADQVTLRCRIETGEIAHAWRLGHLATYEGARSWMTTAADLVVDTSAIDAEQAALVIADAVGTARRGDV